MDSVEQGSGLHGESTRRSSLPSPLKSPVIGKPIPPRGYCGIFGGNPVAQRELVTTKQMMPTMTHEGTIELRICLPPLRGKQCFSCFLPRRHRSHTTSRAPLSWAGVVRHFDHISWFPSTRSPCRMHT